MMLKVCIRKISLPSRGLCSRIIRMSMRLSHRFERRIERDPVRFNHCLNLGNKVKLVQGYYEGNKLESLQGGSISWVLKNLGL